MSKDGIGKYPITEVVQWGSGKVVLYTEDKSLFDKFKSDDKALDSRAYKRDGKWLAGDIWYPKKYQETLTRRLKELKNN